jgi:hypothetical protein
LLIPDAGAALALGMTAELEVADPAGAEVGEEPEEVAETAAEVELSRLDRLVVRIAVVLTGPGGMKSEVEVLMAVLLLLLPLDGERDESVVGNGMVRVVESTMVGNVSRLSTVLAARVGDKWSPEQRARESLLVV